MRIHPFIKAYTKNPGFKQSCFGFFLTGLGLYTSFLSGVLWVIYLSFMAMGFWMGTHFVLVYESYQIFKAASKCAADFIDFLKRKQKEQEKHLTH